MALTDFTFISRSITGRLFSTGMTVLTVAVGVGLLLVLLGMRDAADQAFARGSGNMHFLISRDSGELASVLNGVYYADVPNAPITWAQYQTLSTGYPWAWAIPTQLGDSYRGRPVMSTTPAFFSDFEPVQGRPWVFTEGRPFEKKAASPFEIVAGAEAAESAGLRVGDRISVFHGPPRGESHAHDEYVFEVVGVLAPSGTPHDRALFTELTSAWILHAADDKTGLERSLTEADIDEQDRLITGVYARLLTRDPGQASLPANGQQVFEQIRRDGTYTIALPPQQIASLFAIVGDINGIIVGLAAAVLVSGAVTLMLVLYQAMDLRRRQIATLRVLGCSQPRVFGLVVTESAVIGTVGAVAGFVLSLVGAQIVAGLLYDRLGLVITPGLEPRIVLTVMTGTIALAALAGMIPAMSAYRTSVVRNLRPIG